MQDWEAWVRRQRIAMTIWYDPERSIRIWCLHEDDGLSFPYRLQKFPLFLSSSYRLQKFADTDRLRVNRRPIRKDFFPDRYDFVPIVFTSSSCKRGLRKYFRGDGKQTISWKERDVSLTWKEKCLLQLGAGDRQNSFIKIHISTDYRRSSIET